jgi:hypothetical protein
LTGEKRLGESTERRKLRNAKPGRVRVLRSTKFEIRKLLRICARISPTEEIKSIFMLLRLNGSAVRFKDISIFHKRICFQ